MNQAKADIHILVVLIWGLTSVALGADLSLVALKSNQASKRNAGSATTLAGTSLVYQIFVADRASSWPEHQKKCVSSDVIESLAFLSQQSKRYAAQVSFKVQVATDVFFPEVIPTDTFVDPVWTERVIRLGHNTSGNHLVARLKHEHDADNVLVCLHVNKSALSYNLAHYDSVDETYLAERMICFGRYPDGRPTAAATYAHEILHLFGAGDLYFPYDKLALRKDLANQLFPDDIMRRVDYDMSRLSVGPFTAFRVGWLDQLKPQHVVFED